MTTLELAAELATELTTRRERALEAKTRREPSKPRRIYASGFSECERQMTYAFSHYKDKASMSVSGQASVDDGIAEEELLVAECGALGLPILERGRPFDDDRLWITGRIDGAIAWKGRRIPIELKRVKPFVFQKITSVEDLKDDLFLRKYMTQFLAYLYLTNNEAGLLGFSDGLGQRKWIVVPLDWSFVDTEIAQRAERVKAVVARIEQARHDDPTADIEPLLPPRIPYGVTCRWCSFKDVCLPDLHAGDGAQLADSDLAAQIAEYAALQPGVARAERLKQTIKVAVEGKEMLLAGNYLVTGKWQERTVKAQPERTDRYWKWDVESLNGPSIGAAAG